jgi:transcriptional regulator with XRE-family HTH domain
VLFPTALTPSRRDPPRRQLKVVKVAERHRHTLLEQRLSYGDAPFRGDAALAPFPASSFARAEFGASCVNELPCDGRVHSESIGQSVPNVKANLPNDFHLGRWHKMSMRDVMTPKEFEELFIARTKALRELNGKTSAEMAMALGIPPERYRKYESRSPMPHDLIEKFALIVGQPLAFVMTGRRVRGGGPYPEVPGPHTLEEHREAKAAKAAKPSKRAGKTKAA